MSADEKLVAEWRARCVSPWPWREAGQKAGELSDKLPHGEAGGHMMECEELGGRRGYMKPRLKERESFRGRAVREKIVSDLACDLGVPVPPVLLWTRPDAPADEEEHCCISLVMYRHQWSWKEVKRFIIDHKLLAPNLQTQLMTHLPSAGAKGLALDAWVMQSDHGDHPHNIIFGYDETEPGQFLFLDYAFALGHKWLLEQGGRKLGWRSWETEEGWKAPVEIPFPPHMDRFLQLEDLGLTIEAIEDFPEDTIQEVVSRVPGSYMADEEKEIVIRGLIERRQLIRPALQEQLGHDRRIP